MERKEGKRSTTRKNACAGCVCEEGRREDEYIEEDEEDNEDKGSGCGKYADERIPSGCTGDDTNEEEGENEPKDEENEKFCFCAGVRRVCVCGSGNGSVPNTLALRISRAFSLRFLFSALFSMFLCG